MLAAVRSAAVLGVDAYRVTVEVDANQGLPQWTIVGLPAASVKESRMFVQDQGADGLNAHPGGDQPADSWDEGDKSVAFDGDWKKAKIAEADYTKKYTDADDRYSRMLATLLAQAKTLKAKAGS